MTAPVPQPLTHTALPRPVITSSCHSLISTPSISFLCLVGLVWGDGVGGVLFVYLLACLLTVSLYILHGTQTGKVIILPQPHEGWDYSPCFTTPTMHSFLDPSSPPSPWPPHSVTFSFIPSQLWINLSLAHASKHSIIDLYPQPSFDFFKFWDKVLLRCSRCNWTHSGTQVGSEVVILLPQPSE